MSSIAIHSTLALPYCWVCRGTEGLHEHHIVPQSYGGTNGPTVTLCANHHNLIHAVSLKRKDKWRFQGPSEQCAKLFYLTTVIANARSATKHLRRPMQLSQTLDINRTEKLRAIQKIQGLSSLEKTLAWAIDVAHKKCTPLS